MTCRDLLILYAAIGVAAGVLVYRRRTSPRRTWSAIGTALLWPLWAPFTLLEPRAAGAATQGTRDLTGLDPIERALLGAVAAVAGTPYEPLFSPVTAARFREVAARAAARKTELDVALEAESLSPAPAEITPAVARARCEALGRLRELRKLRERELADLAAALETLRCRLLLARFDEGECGDIAELVADASAQVEALAEAGVRAATH